MTLELGRTHPTVWMRSREVAAGTDAIHRENGGSPVQVLTGRHGDAGFLVPVVAFRESMAAAGVAGALDAIRAEAAVADGPVRERLHRAASDLVRSAGPSAGLVAAVAGAYPGLGIEDFGPARVVVRAATASGPTEPVRGLTAVLAAIVDRWAEGVGSGVGETAVLVHVAPPAHARLRDLR